MPKFKTHISFNLIVGLPIAITTVLHIYNPKPQELYIFAASFFYASFFLHPDLDIARKYKLLSLKGLLTFPFRSYSYFFSHRGISHMPIIGTITRILWLYTFLWIGSKLFDFDIPQITNFNKSWTFYAFIAVVSADICHTFLDWITTKIKS